MYNDDVLVMILAGGEGKRLYPLTRDRAKPAVPFGGRYRIIDFVLNNFTNSGFYKIKILPSLNPTLLIGIFQGHGQFLPYWDNLLILFQLR